ncbi:LOW QUALITY PROTEIN: uncharacterized protein [Antedon mediterranea]|uniref:LOW QUALITY PROTEIN: uncharacterized protein n=1 Tax=Antedon mediterranea TaxID=105859 RepID=UPI003AF96BD2
MVFICVSIRTATKIVKPPCWYARTVLDGRRTLADIFSDFAGGEFDQGGPIGDQYQTTECEECLKWRVCYAAHVLKRDQGQLLERELDTLSYSCGTCFQDILGEDDSIVFVNDKMTCALPLEAAYYITFTDPLCFYCGTEHNLSIENMNYPLCSECKESGKTPKRKNTRAFVPQ